MAEADAKQKPGLLCISTYEKGQALMREAARLGCAVALLTVHRLRQADWPWDALAAFETMPEDLPAEAVLPYVARLAKHRKFERVIALDEFDLDTAALVREHLRVPGMGRTPTRPFRDKLTMREFAQKAGIPVPEFCGVTNHDALWAFLSSTEGPWLLKPRSSASAIGIQKISEPNAVWPLLEKLGDEATNHLVERFVPGEIYHVEGLSWHGELKFALAHKYGQPPFETMHAGGVFSTRTLERDGDEAGALLKIHARHAARAGDDDRTDAHGVHSRACRWEVLLPGDRGAGGRRVYRGGDRGGERGEPVGGVGAAGVRADLGQPSTRCRRRARSMRAA